MEEILEYEFKSRKFREKYGKAYNRGKCRRIGQSN